MSAPRIQRLQNFHPLLQADRQFLDDGIGIDLHLIFVLKPLQFGARLGDPLVEDGAVLGAQHDIFKHGEILDQHEVLVDHADAGGDRRIGIAG